MSFLKVSAARKGGAGWKKSSVIVPHLTYFNNVNTAPQPPLRLYILELKEPLNKREFHLKNHFKNIENEVFIKNAWSKKDFRDILWGILNVKKIFYFRHLDLFLIKEKRLFKFHSSED
jgi:hypothetical protein